MATLILTAVGNFLGGPIGAAIGSSIGRLIDGGPNVRREGPRLAELSIQTSSYGEVLPLVYGTSRIAGNIIWSSGLIERRSEQTQGGKGGSVTTTSYSYFASFAVAIAACPLAAVRRIWADGKLIRTPDGTLLPGGSLRIHLGSEIQLPDTLLEAALGLDYAPAHRGLSYVVFEELALADFANRIPNLTFEVDSLPNGNAQSIALLFDDLLGRAGIRQRDARAASGSVKGFAISSNSSARTILETLQPVGPFVLQDATPAMTVASVSIDQASVLLAARQIGAHAPLESPRSPAPVRRRLQSAEALPDEIQLRYADPQRDYQVNMHRARRSELAAGKTEVLDLPLVMDASEAKQHAERLLARRWRQRAQLTVRLPLPLARILPGKTIAFDDRPGDLWLVHEAATEQDGISLTLLPLSRADQGSRALADNGPAISQNPDPHGPTTGYLLDLPPVEANLPTTARLFAVAAGPSAGWRRATLLLSTDNGQSYTSAASLTSATTLGSAATPLAPASTALWDERSMVEVELLAPAMVLLSRSRQAVLEGANLALLGNELIQFASAEPVNATRWRISTLLRGRRGTEAAIDSHAAGERFVLLDPLPATVQSLPLGQLGSQLRYKLLSPGEQAGAASSQTFQVQAQALQPLSPVQGRIDRLGDGALQLSWIRRSRDGFAWLDGADAVLAEESERYRVSLLASGTVLRSAEVTGPSWTYSSAQQQADGFPAGAIVRIQQLSAAVGPGASLMLALP